MKATGNVTPDKVAPNEAIIDTTLIIRLNTGKREERLNANAWVAQMNSMVMPFIVQRLHGKGICIQLKNTTLASIPTAAKRMV